MIRVEKKTFSSKNDKLSIADSKGHGLPDLLERIEVAHRTGMIHFERT